MLARMQNQFDHIQRAFVWQQLTNIIIAKFECCFDFWAQLFPFSTLNLYITFRFEWFNKHIADLKYHFTKLIANDKYQMEMYKIALYLSNWNKFDAIARWISLSFRCCQMKKKKKYRKLRLCQMSFANEHKFTALTLDVIAVWFLSWKSLNVIIVVKRDHTFCCFQFN